jgi:DNA mismatch repair protein MutL
MLPVDYRSAIASISGFISSPTISRSSRKDITIFVNGRLVKDSAIQLATEKAFENVLKPGRFPIAILKIAVPPDNVDVNVHPNKREVRFVDSQAIFRAVQAACEKTLRMHSPLTRPQTMPLPDETSFEKPAQVQQNALTTELPAEVIFQDDEFQKTPTTLFRSHPAQSLLRHGEVIEYLNTYLVFEDSGELTVVDFHNLHERILFEEMEDAERSETGGVPSQKLMFPESFTLPPDLAQILEENFDFINRMGFEVEPFGSGAFILRAVPHFIKHDSVAEALIDILRETLDESSGSPVLMDFRRRFKISTACKSAIKAGKRLKPEEMEFLLRHATDARYMNCPHGRPTIIKLDRSFFDSRFKRRSNV